MNDESHLQCNNCSDRMMAKTSLLTIIEIEYLEPDLSYKDGKK